MAKVTPLANNNMQKIGVLTSGGDAPGMNACIRAVVRTAAQYGLEVVGIRRGYSGLLAGELVKLNRRFVANIMQRGGTVLESSRCEEFKTPAGRKKGIEVLRQEGIDGLVVIGGDGSFRGAVALSEEGKIKVVGIPATIDNDIYGTDYTIGFDTAINTALEAVDRIRDTANAFERVFFAEVMGRRAGFIALEVGVAAGTEEVILPEVKIDVEDLCQSLREAFRRGKRSSIVIVAEGNEVGHTVQIAQYVNYRLKVDCRVCVLGHLQRGGEPSARDRLLASKLGMAAVEAILNGNGGCMVGEVKGDIVHSPLHESWEKTKEISKYWLDALKVLAK
jgi:6-phosphofructokinase 1